MVLLCNVMVQPWLNTVMTLNLKSCLEFLSSTVRCRKWVLARDIGLGNVAVQCHGVDLI